MALPTEYEALVRKHEKASVALKNAAKKKKAAKKTLKEQKKDAAKKDVAIAKLELKKASLKKEAKKIALEIAKYKLQNWEKGQGKPEKPTAPIVEKKEKKEKEKGEKPTNKLDIVIENPIVETTETVVKTRKPRTKKTNKTVENVEETVGKTKKTRMPKAEKMPPPVGDHDDFTKIEGIGAKAAATLVENGIKTFAALAEQNPDELKKNLFTSRVYNLVKPSQHWIEQAKLAAAGNFEALEAMKKTLRGGK